MVYLIVYNFFNCYNHIYYFKLTVKVKIRFGSFSSYRYQRSGKKLHSRQIDAGSFSPYRPKRVKEDFAQEKHRWRQYLFTTNHLFPVRHQLLLNGTKNSDMGEA